MWKLKGCPRCGGDTFLDRDLDSWYEQCLQCSYRHELKNVDEFNEPSLQEKNPPVLAGENPPKGQTAS
jgi:ribosomal protein S27AE